MGFVELAGVTVALIFAFVALAFLQAICTATETRYSDPRPFIKKAFMVFVLVEIGAHNAVLAVLGVV
jgi:hypothetical protein